MSNNQIAIINYKMGNLRSLEKAFQKIGANVLITDDIQEIRNSKKIVLPGVGSFRDGMKYLKELNLISVLNEEVLQSKKPFLGICLGMQLICKRSFENGETNGLGWIDGDIVKFEFNAIEGLKIPHVGWNNVSFKQKSQLYKNISDESDFYFVHSYYLKTNENSIALSVTDYGFNFISSINKDNIYACQFHPEKSQSSGLQLIENFINI